MPSFIACISGSILKQLLMVDKSRNTKIQEIFLPTTFLPTVIVIKNCDSISKCLISGKGIHFYNLCKQSVTNPSETETAKHNISLKTHSNQNYSPWQDQKKKYESGVLVNCHADCINMVVHCYMWKTVHCKETLHHFCAPYPPCTWCICFSDLASNSATLFTCSWICVCSEEIY